MAPFFPAFNALFRNGHSTKEIDLGMQIDEVEKLDKKFFDDGFRMRFLYRYWGDGSYQAAWEPGSGAQFWIATDDFDEFKSAEEKHAKKGLRFKYLHSSVGHYTAIWHPGSGNQFWKVNISFEEFKAEDAKLKSQGLMLMQMCDDGGKYSGFWQPGTKNYSWISTSKRDQFDEFTKENSDNGRLAVALGGEQFCAVYHETKGEQKFVFGINEKGFKKKAEELFKDNFHIADFFMTAGENP
ncbi:MAG TPA: hypothetical protein VMI12_09500 [Puia sp.]|nr:hypothetical protein [Puia sp.]